MGCGRNGRPVASQQPLACRYPSIAAWARILRFTAPQPHPCPDEAQPGPGVARARRTADQAADQPVGCTAPLQAQLGLAAASSGARLPPAQTLRLAAASMMWPLVAAALAVVTLAVAAASHLAIAMAKAKARRELASAKARWELQHRQDSPATMLESFTLGWLNVVVDAVWLSLLEKYLSSEVAELLAKIFREVGRRRRSPLCLSCARAAAGAGCTRTPWPPALSCHLQVLKEHSDKKPWSLISSIEVEQVGAPGCDTLPWDMRHCVSCEPIAPACKPARQLPDAGGPLALSLPCS